ncbi:RNA recognition motif [Medicago truncatula]|uniref:RNA recognition motif n=1 Tax=Medicago truncatula TaxID=3880 RepID=G7KWS7_MEDTR|nr:RNA recognition motif [Medicago truncatula]
MSMLCCPEHIVYFGDIGYENLAARSCLLLFSKNDELEGYSIHYDQFGESKGTAEVFFTRESDALAALRRCNQMKLYGKTLQIELVGTTLVTPALLLQKYPSFLLFE